MVKVKIPEKFCLFTFFCPLRPLLRSPSVSLLLPFVFLYLALSFPFTRCSSLRTARQSLFHSLHVFEKRPLVTLFENVAQNGIRVVYRCGIIRSDFRLLFYFLPFFILFFLSFFFFIVNHSCQATRCLVGVVFDILMTTHRFPLPHSRI